MNHRPKPSRRPSSVGQAARKSEADEAWGFFNGEEPAELPAICTHDVPVGHRCSECGNVKREAIATQNGES